MRISVRTLLTLRPLSAIDAGALCGPARARGLQGVRVRRVRQRRRLLGGPAPGRIGDDEGSGCPSSAGQRLGPPEQHAVNAARADAGHGRPMRQPDWRSSARPSPAGDHRLRTSTRQRPLGRRGVLGGGAKNRRPSTTEVAPGPGLCPATSVFNLSAMRIRAEGSISRTDSESLGRQSRRFTRPPAHH